MNLNKPKIGRAELEAHRATIQAKVSAATALYQESALAAARGEPDAVKALARAKVAEAEAFGQLRDADTSLLMLEAEERKAAREQAATNHKNARRELEKANAQRQAAANVLVASLEKAGEAYKRFSEASEDAMRALGKPRSGLTLAYQEIERLTLRQLTHAGLPGGPSTARLAIDPTGTLPFADEVSRANTVLLAVHDSRAPK